MQKSEITDADLEAWEQGIDQGQGFELRTADFLDLIKALRAYRAQSKAKDAVIRMAHGIVKRYDQAVAHNVIWRSPLWREFKEKLAALDKEIGDAKN